jgi:hypothetical protein
MVFVGYAHDPVLFPIDLAGCGDTEALRKALRATLQLPLKPRRVRFYVAGCLLPPELPLAALLRDMDLVRYACRCAVP